MKRILTLAFPLILTSFLTVLVSRLAILFVPEMCGLFGAPPEAFPMWRTSEVELKLAFPILSGIIVTMLVCGLRSDSKPARVLKPVIVAAAAIGFAVLTVVTAKVNGAGLLALIRAAV